MAEAVPTNVEIKAVVRDWEQACQAAAALSDTPLEIIDQEDTFFFCPTGRLKLRQFSKEHGELIAYRRENLSGTKSSHYLRTKTNDPETLRQALASALGMLGTVRKRRFLYRFGQTRIHLDKVDGLGTFLELEVVLRPDQPATEGDRIACELMRKLEIRRSDLLAGAYLELMPRQAFCKTFDTQSPQLDDFKV